MSVDKVELRSQVLTAMSMKMAVCWDAAQCSLVEVYLGFRGVCCLHHQCFGLITKVVSTSETSVNFYQTTHRNIPEDIFIFTVLSFFKLKDIQIVKCHHDVKPNTCFFKH
jgi:hypothetical protein